MKYKNFSIENYKGIKSLNLDLSMSPESKIFTLVGLNESGKTTILEAINNFEHQVPKEHRHLLLPKSQAGGFNGDVIIRATFSFTQEDIDAIKLFIQDELKAGVVTVNDEVVAERKYKFINSVPAESALAFNDFIFIKRGEKLRSVNTDMKEKVVSFLKKNLYPTIIYYRDFLSKFPDKVQLNLSPENPDEHLKNLEYLSIIEDILFSTNKNYDVKSSLLDRLNEKTDANNQALDAVLNEISAKVSKVVFDAWNKIQQVSRKYIVIQTYSENNNHYVKFNVKESDQTFSIAERSLGFRWFFTFLLFTEFRKVRNSRSGEILFLLDEPASNLHQTAQKGLLETFNTITDKSRLIYTTHSHHLINPKLLNSCYIIKNLGLSYEDDNNFNSSKTEIEAMIYKKFASIHPNQSSYFQPILDVLDYSPGDLEFVPSIVILEGKFDFYVFNYLYEVVLGFEINKLRFYPGHGAGKLDLPISLYESWGRCYLVLLDDDSQGRLEKKRYIENISDAKHIYTLADVNSHFSNLCTEDLFSEDERLNISREFESSLTEYKKSAFNTGIQELYLQKRVPSYISEETRIKFEEIFKFLLAQQHDLT